MTTFQIKLIAIITMVIDHIGLFFFPDIAVFRVIGRLSFPLFAWLIANGAHYTKNIKVYLARLFIFAVIAQIPYILAARQINPDFWNLNVMFTLFLGLAAIVILRSIKNKMISVYCVLLCSLSAAFFQADYAAAGVLSIVLFYLAFRNIVLMIFFQVMLYVIFYVFPVVVQLIIEGSIQNVIVWLIQPVGLLSLGLIYFYNHKEGSKAKNLLYLFYPLQFIVIWLLLLIF